MEFALETIKVKIVHEVWCVCARGAMGITRMANDSHHGALRHTLSTWLARQLGPAIYSSPQNSAETGMCAVQAQKHKARPVTPTHACLSKETEVIQRHAKHSSIAGIIDIWPHV